MVSSSFLNLFSRIPLEIDANKSCPFNTESSCHQMQGLHSHRKVMEISNAPKLLLLFLETLKIKEI